MKTEVIRQLVSPPPFPAGEIVESGRDDAPVWRGPVVLVGIIAAIMVVPWHFAAAADRTWIGGDSPPLWVDGSGIADWNPNDEPDLDDKAIFDQQDTVELGSSNLVAALELSGGAVLNSNGHDLGIRGLLELLEPGAAELLIDDGASAVSAYEVSIDPGTRIRLRGGELTVSRPTGDGLLRLWDGTTPGTLSGFGTLLLDDNTSVATSLLINDGMIAAQGVSLGLFLPPAAATLAIDSPWPNARIDLDGRTMTGGDDGAVEVQRNQTFDINVPLHDGFSGAIGLFHEATLDISSAWTLNSGSIDANSGFVDRGSLWPDIPAGVSVIAGGALTQTGGTITVADDDGTLQFDAEFNHSGGSVVNNGLVVFNADVSGTAPAVLSMLTNTSSITVGPGATVDLDYDWIDLDGYGQVTNVITVDGGTLDLDVDAIDLNDDSFDGSLIMAGTSELKIAVFDPYTGWEMDGTAEFNGFGTKTITGSRVTIDGSVDVNGGRAQFVWAVDTGGTASVDVAAGAAMEASVRFDAGFGSEFTIDGSLDLNGSTYWGELGSGGPGSVAGSGIISQNGDAWFHGDTIIDTATYNMDGLGTTTVTIYDDVSVTINSSKIEATAGSDGFDGTLELREGATLSVNTDDPWPLEGDMTLAGDTQLNGSRMVVEGIVTSTGGVTSPVCNAPVTLASGGALSITGLALRLNGDVELAGGDCGTTGTLRTGGEVTVSADTTIEVGSLDWSAGGAAAGWRVESGVALTILADTYFFEGDRIAIADGATMSVNGPDHTSWRITSGSVLQLEGDPVGGVPQATVTGDDWVVNLGRITGSGRFHSTVVQNYGFVIPGLSAGTLYFDDASLILEDSTNLYFELEGGDQTSGAGINDLIDNVSDLTLGGTLHVSELSPGSFASQAGIGDAWTLITYTGTLLDNGLALGTLPALSPGLVFFLQDTGSEIKLVVGTAYTAWMGGHGIFGADTNPTGDHDGDGLQNGIEYVLGTDPTLHTPLSDRPVFDRQAASSSFVFRRSDVSAGDSPRVEYDVDLVPPFTMAADGVGGVTVIEDNDFYGPGIDRVLVILPDSLAVDGRLFARLAVEPAQ